MNKKIFLTRKYNILTNIFRTRNISKIIKNYRIYNYDDSFDIINKKGKKDSIIRYSYSYNYLIIYKFFINIEISDYYLSTYTFIKNGLTKRTFLCIVNTNIDLVRSKTGNNCIYMYRYKQRVHKYIYYIIFNKSLYIKYIYQYILYRYIM